MNRQEFFLFCDHLQLTKYDVEQLVGTQRWNMERDFRQVDDSFRQRFDYAFVKAKFSEAQLYVLKKNRVMLTLYYRDKLKIAKIVTTIIDGVTHTWLDCTPDSYTFDFRPTPTLEDMKIPLKIEDLIYYQDHSIEYSRYKFFNDSLEQEPFPHFWHELKHLVTAHMVVTFAGQFNQRSRDWFHAETGVQPLVSLFDNTKHVLATCNMAALIKLYRSIDQGRSILPPCVHDSMLCCNCSLYFLDHELRDKNITGVHTFKEKVFVFKENQFCIIDCLLYPKKCLKTLILADNAMYPRVIPVPSFSDMAISNHFDVPVMQPDVVDMIKLNTHYDNPRVTVEMWNTYVVCEQAIDLMGKLNIGSMFQCKRFGVLYDVWLFLRENPVYRTALKELHYRKRAPFFLLLEEEE